MGQYLGHLPHFSIASSSPVVWDPPKNAHFPEKPDLLPLSRLSKPHQWRPQVGTAGRHNPALQKGLEGLLYAAVWFRTAPCLHSGHPLSIRYLPWAAQRCYPLLPLSSVSAAPFFLLTHSFGALWTAGPCGGPTPASCVC